MKLKRLSIDQYMETIKKNEKISINGNARERQEMMWSKRI